MQALKLFGLTYSAFQKEVEGRPQPQGFFRRLLSFNLGEDKAAKKVERLVFAELHTKQPWFYPNLDREGALIHFENITNQTQTDGLFLYAMLNVPYIRIVLVHSAVFSCFTLKPYFFQNNTVLFDSIFYWYFYRNIE